MNEYKFRVDAMTEDEIRQRLGEIDSSVAIKEIIGPALPGRRRSMGMEPFSYFIVVFAAHLAAGLTHDFLLKQIRKRFSDKGIVEGE